MTLLARKPMNLLLSVFMVIQTIFPLQFAIAKTPEIYSEQANEFAGLIRNSQQIPAGQPRNSFAPDRFLLLDQEVVSKTYVGREFSLISNAREREIETHQSRLDHARIVLRQAEGLGATEQNANVCLPLQSIPELQKAHIEKELVEHLNDGRRKDIPFFVYREKNDLSRLNCVREQLSQIINNWEISLESETLITDVEAPVPNITKAHEKERPLYVNWWDVQIDLMGKNEIVDSLKMSQNADYKENASAAVAECGGVCEFQFRAKDRVIHKFHIPTSTIASFGPYLIFTHPDSYDATTGIQYLSYIDLMSYSPSLGKSDIPVFRLPLQLGEQSTQLSVAKRQLTINGKYSIPVEAFAAASEIQRAAFNITANLVDPAQLAELTPYIQSLEKYVEKIVASEFQDRREAASDLETAQVLFKDLGRDVIKQLEQNKNLKDFSNGKSFDLPPEQLAVLPEETRSLLETYSHGLVKSEFLDKRLNAVSKRMNEERGIKARLGAFFNKIMSPVPNGSLSVKRALIRVGMQRPEQQNNFMTQLMDRPWLAATVASTAVIAAVAPESFGHVLETSLAVGNAIVDYVKFSTLGIWEAVKVGTVATVDPIFTLGGSLGEQYIYDGRWQKTLTGLGVFVPFIMSIYYVPHLMFNLHQVAMDYKEQSQKGEWHGFVNHQREFVRNYYQRLAEDDHRRRTEDLAEQSQVSFSPEEEKDIQAFISQREMERSKKGPISRLAGGTKKAFLKLAEKMKLYDPSKDKEKVKGTFSALMTLTFSYPAMELTLSRWARFWNWFAGTRYTSVGFMTLRDVGIKSGFPIFIRPKPISAGVRLFMPDFFNTVVAKQNKKLTIPTVLNGGLRGWERRDLTWYKEKLLGKAPIRNQADAVAEENQLMRESLAAEMSLDAETRDLMEDQARLLNGSELKALSESFEEAILPVEAAAFKEGFGGALERMAEFLTDKDELVEMFTKTPLKTVTEKRVRDMPVKVRTFLRLFMDRVYEQTMKDYLGEVLGAEANLDPASLQPRSLGELKKTILDLNRSIRHSNHLVEGYKFDAKRVTEIARKYAQSQEFFESVAKQAKRGEFSVENFLKNRKYNLMADMDPEQNGSMARYADVQERLKSPNALSRAVRAEISKLLVTFPLDLGFHMFFAAAIFEGAFRPIQDEMLGENSIFYLSQSSFYMGMAAGFTMSMMADAWVKLQEDSRQDKLKGFDNVPKGQDAEGSFLRWYGKQFMHKDNSLMANWGYANRIAFWNLPAALANMGIFYYAFSGRLDLSILLAGYPIAFGTPIGAFSYKINQAFERASEYPARGIPDEKWLAHADIQDLMSKEKQFYRNRFQILNDLFMNIEGNWLMNVKIIPTSLGPRGFLRSMLGGFLPEELVVNHLLHPMANATANIPGVGTVVKAITGSCEHLLTNGNPDLTKLKK